MCRIRRGKVPAFTLIELTVVMAISAILMGVVYYSFHFFYRQYYHLNQTLQQREQQYHFDQQLRKDFSGADYVQDKGQRLQMFFPHKVVFYHFYRDYAVRGQGPRRDTLYLGLYNYQLEEEETAKGDVLVKGMELELQDTKGEELRLLLYRSYSAEILENGIEQQLWQE